MAKFKVGDKVRLKNNLIVNKKYGYVNFLPTMKDNFKGIGTIEKIGKYENDTIAYTIKEGRMKLLYSGEMLELITENDNKKIASELINELIKKNNDIFKNLDVKYTIAEKKAILDNKEKEYLSNVIKPFRDNVISIKKISSHHLGKDYIVIDLYENDFANLPDFEKGTMYNGMELNMEYTLEELGL